MLFAILAAAGSGLAIGLRFRVNMLFAASVVFGLGTIAVAIHSGWSITHTIAILLLLLGVQQGAYLLGLVLAARDQRHHAQVLKARVQILTLRPSQRSRQHLVDFAPLATFAWSGASPILRGVLGPRRERF